jgi:hypothetical protein
MSLCTPGPALGTRTEMYASLLPHHSSRRMRLQPGLPQDVAAAGIAAASQAACRWLRQIHW